MEVQVRCNVKALNIPELKRKLTQNEIADFSNDEYLKSASLRDAIRDRWVTVLKKAKTAPPIPPEEKQPKKPEPKKRGRKPKSS